MFSEYCCRTNLDNYEREEWPMDFIFPPKVGDYVESISGKRLMVCCVTHTWNKRDNCPFVEIELTRKTFR
jgi:hypothetical protein